MSYFLHRILLLGVISLSFSAVAFAQSPDGSGVTRRITGPKVCNANLIMGFGFTTIESNSQARNVLNEVMRAGGVDPSAIEIKAADVIYAMACENKEGGGGFTRYILYSPTWLNELIKEVGTDWTARAILAHEVGHHRKGHLIVLREKKYCAADLEAEADEVAGEILAKLGAKLTEAQAAFEKVAEEKGDECYPSRAERLAAVKRGWERTKLSMMTASEYYQRGRDFIKRNDFDKAIADYTKAIELDPKYTFAYISRGIAYHKKGALDSAIADYTKAINLDQNNSIAYYNRGISYKNKGDLDSAMADYTKAINLDPKHAFAYNNRGNVYYQKGDLDSAMADYTRAINLDQNDSVGYYNRGNVYYKKGALDSAIADFTKAINLDPKYASAYISRGNAYYKKGDLDSAIADYTRSINLDPKYALAYRNRANAYRAKGDYVSEKADRDKAARLESQP